MANKQSQRNKATHITEAKAKEAAEREKRQAEALRENLRRRKTSPEPINQPGAKKPTN
ncbi:MAG: hypothetical protein HN884_03520 [Rhodospirillaceae bacterium]|nr:hypothetical protein [Rhodospirillaceae bacterium]MBT4590294.1 hypothetical protein [Rhodospirillaceae bacterium]MBT7265918.1 hypothetical protein [Rhodospirillaceae bacterium]